MVSDNPADRFAGRVPVETRFLRFGNTIFAFGNVFFAVW